MRPLTDTIRNRFVVPAQRLAVSSRWFLDCQCMSISVRQLQTENQLRDARELQDILDKNGCDIH